MIGFLLRRRMGRGTRGYVQSSWRWGGFTVDVVGLGINRVYGGLSEPRIIHYTTLTTLPMNPRQSSRPALSRYPYHTAPNPNPSQNTPTQPEADAHTALECHSPHIVHTRPYMRPMAGYHIALLAKHSTPSPPLPRNQHPKKFGRQCFTQTPDRPDPGRAASTTAFPPYNPPNTHTNTHY